MTSHKPRIVMFASAALAVVVVLVFGLAILDARDDRHDAAEQRFSDKAVVSAALIESFFGSSLPSVTEQLTKRFSGQEIERDQMEAMRKRSRLSYLIVLDEQGKMLGQIGAEPSVLASLDERPAHIDAVLGGAPYTVSGITSGDNAEYVSGMETPYGKRFVVQGFPVTLLSEFVGGTIAKLPDAERERAFVIDKQNRVVAAADESVGPGDTMPQLAGDRVEVRADIANSDWQVVLSQRRADLFRGVNSVTPWLILAALALAGLVTIMLLRRAMQTGVQLQTAYEDLERTNADLARTNIELERSNGELEQFASVASHDLQEPLRKVQTFGDQLERRHADRLDEEARDYLHRMRDASARMSVLIEDLLRFSRVTTHAKPPEAVDLGRVAREVAQDLEASVAETGGRIEIGPLPTVLADPTQMRQLLQNLISNALKFHRSGVPPVVEVHAVAAQPGAVAFEVSDNGIGFEDAYEERIFRVFERLHARNVYAGTGIGLALCRKIAERHGGSITGSGRPGEGATFTVVLPAVPGAEPAGAPGRQEPVTRDALRDAPLHSDLRTVVDGVEAMAYLRRTGEYADPQSSPRPGLILLDLNMPRMDGRETLVAIKEDPALRSIPVVVLTTSKAEVDVLRSYDLGVNSFITKPVTFRGLVEVMNVFSRYWFGIVELPARVAR